MRNYIPRRHDGRRAQADLEAKRAAAADKPTRAEHLQAMATEAHRLQVAIAVEREKFDWEHMQTENFHPYFHPHFCAIL